MADAAAFFPLTERTPETKRAYVDGVEAGWKLAVSWMRLGATAAAIEADCTHLTDYARRSIRGPATAPPIEEHADA
jgi:hypothetical protein